MDTIQIGTHTIQTITSISKKKSAEIFLVHSESGSPMILIEDTVTEHAAVYERLKTLQPPYIPSISEVVLQGGKLYVLEEYIEGTDLDDKLQQGGLTCEDALRIMEQLCLVLSSLHHEKPPIIHRDLKPENILLTEDGSICLIDFDAAREYSKKTKSHDTVLLGTRGYAAPEQFGFAQTDPRSDIYSLGIVCSRIAEHAAIPSRQLKQLQKIITRATMFDPENRYPGVNDMLRDIRRLSSAGSNKRFKRAALAGCIMLIPLTLILFLMLRAIQNTAQSTRGDAASDHVTDIASQTGSVTAEPTQTPDGSITSAPTQTPTAPATDIPSPPIDPTTDTETPSGTITPPPFIAMNTMDPDNLPGYHHISVYEEASRDANLLLETYPALCSTLIDLTDTDDQYAPDQICFIGRDYLTFRFSKEYPQDYFVYHYAFEGKSVSKVVLEHYDWDQKLVSSDETLPLTDCYIKDGFLTIRKEALGTLETGAYNMSVYYVDPQTGQSWFWPYYVMVYDTGAKVDNFAVLCAVEKQYFSRSKQNDVFFHLLNTPFPIQSVECNGELLDRTAYYLTEDGRGLVLPGSLLTRYQDALSCELKVTMQNGRWACGRVINLD